MSRGTRPAQPPTSTSTSSRRPPPPRPRPARGAGPSSATAALGRGRGISGATLKRIAWTGAFAAIAVVGTVYGAGLRTQQEYQAEKKHIVELSIDDRIRDLEGRRAELAAQRWPLEHKIGEVRARIRASEEKGGELNNK
ncbi:hypothetical protein F4810DRAFT_676651 [Camillea tinctor]|nr:hypothetical protein F4810DRAFT_676651 [Camillea tinctor]